MIEKNQHKEGGFVTMPVIQFVTTVDVENNLIRIPEEYADTIHPGIKVTVSFDNNLERHSEPAKVSRTGFLKDQLTIPKDFDRMCETEIAEIFGQK